MSVGRWYILRLTNMKESTIKAIDIFLKETPAYVRQPSNVNDEKRMFSILKELRLNGDDLADVKDYIESNASDNIDKEYVFKSLGLINRYLDFIELYDGTFKIQ